MLLFMPKLNLKLKASQGENVAVVTADEKVQYVQPITIGRLMTR